MKQTCIGLLIGVALFFLSSCSSDSSSGGSTSTFKVNTSLSSTRAASRTCGAGGIVCTGSPLSLTFKIYQAWVSPNADCSSPVEVANNGASGADVSLGVDTLIQGSPPDGTYRCLILKASDNLRFVPNSTAVTAFPGVCSTGVTSTFDIYRTDSGDAGLWKDKDGNAIAASGVGNTPGDDTVFIYATTNAASVTGGAIGAHSNQTVTLTGNLVVPGNTTFYIDFADGITGSTAICKIEGGNGLGFR